MRAVRVFERTKITCLGLASALDIRQGPKKAGPLKAEPTECKAEKQTKTASNSQGSLMWKLRRNSSLSVFCNDCDVVPIGLGT